jgi:hypothetical protein
MKEKGNILVSKKDIVLPAHTFQDRPCLRCSSGRPNLQNTAVTFAKEFRKENYSCLQTSCGKLNFLLIVLVVQ